MKNTQSLSIVWAGFVGEGFLFARCLVFKLAYFGLVYNLYKLV